MQRLILSVLFAFLSSASQAQTIAPSESPAAEISVLRNLLLGDVRSLEIEVLKLDKPLARALAQAEMADAAWTLDEEWARKLLREAYELPLPPEAEQVKLRARAVGAPPVLATGREVSRNLVRGRVLRVASRDQNFGVELVNLGLEKLGSYETHQRYSQLAEQAAKNGDKDSTSDYVLKAIEADPTHLGPVDAINELALTDRAAADNLILQYIEQLRKFPLSHQNQSDLRTFYILQMLISPRSLFQPQRKFPAPGAAVMRAYVMYEVERIGKLEGDSLQRNRLSLLYLLEPLRKYAPELSQIFMELEARSRVPGDNSPPPTRKSMQEQDRERYEKRLKDALDSGQPDELTINSIISRGDFDKARKLIAKLPDGAQKTQFTEMVNTKEAVSLAARGDITGAEQLAEQLTRAVSLLEAYPAIIKRCVADKNQPCITRLVHQAVRQLKRADLTPHTPPASIPMSIVPSNREFDPVLASLSKLASLIAPLDRQLALEVLDEVVATANSSALDTEQGRTGIEVELFRQLASVNEIRVRQAAESLKDRLRRIVATSAVYQARASELAKPAKK